MKALDVERLSQFVFYVFSKRSVQGLSWFIISRLLLFLVAQMIYSSFSFIVRSMSVLFFQRQGDVSWQLVVLMIVFSFLMRVRRSYLTMLRVRFLLQKMVSSQITKFVLFTRLGRRQVVVWRVVTQFFYEAYSVSVSVRQGIQGMTQMRLFVCNGFLYYASDWCFDSCVEVGFSIFCRVFGYTKIGLGGWVGRMWGKDKQG